MDNALQPSGECLSGVKNLRKYTSSEGNELGSRTSGVCSKKVQKRMFQTKFFYLGVKCDPLTVSLFSISHKCFELQEFYSEVFSLHSLHRFSHIFRKYWSRSELVGKRTKVQSETVENMANAPPTSGECSLSVRNH